MQSTVFRAVVLVAALSIVGCALSTPQSASRKLDTWLYIKYDNGRERWIGFPGGLQFTKFEHGGVEFIDNSTLTSQSFDAKRSPYITENSFPDRPSEPIVVDWLKTPQDFMEMRVESLETGEHQDLEKSIEVLDGRSLDRYDYFARDALGERNLGLQIWVDRDARILVREREWISPRKPIMGDYRIVASGPSSIHDLGQRKAHTQLGSAVDRVFLPRGPRKNNFTVGA